MDKKRALVVGFLWSVSALGLITDAKLLEDFPGLKTGARPPKQLLALFCIWVVLLGSVGYLLVL